MPVVHIGTPGEHLHLATASDKGPPELLTAKLESGGLTARVAVVQHYASGFRDLVEFFSSMEVDWRGWDGHRRWESSEGDLAIDARHQLGHVRLTVTLRERRITWAGEGWHATADIILEPGEQLSQVARDVSALAAGVE